MAGSVVVRALWHELGATRHQGALPCIATVEGLEDAEPGVAGFVAAAQQGFEIDSAVVIRAR